jgi:hypothetical protein
MRTIMFCLVLAAALAGCDADADLVGPASSAPSTPSLATCLRRSVTPGAHTPPSTSRSSNSPDARCRRPAHRLSR